LLGDGGSVRLGLRLWELVNRNSPALLAETNRQGYAQLAGVVDPDTWGIAVPVLDQRKNALAALGVVVPLHEMRLQALVPALQTAARGIGRQLGNAGT
jgi:DNA-binding IclR family transcriptional regulator